MNRILSLLLQPSWGYRVDPFHPGGNKDIRHLGGGVSGGLPLISNGPNNPSLAIGGAASGGVGTVYVRLLMQTILNRFEMFSRVIDIKWDPILELVLAQDFPSVTMVEHSHWVVVVHL